MSCDRRSDPLPLTPASADEVEALRRVRERSGGGGGMAPAGSGVVPDFVRVLEALTAAVRSLGLAPPCTTAAGRAPFELPPDEPSAG